MIKTAIVVLLCVGAIFAQPIAKDDASEFAKTLEKRGETILAAANRVLDQVREDGHEHLVHAFEHELALLEALIVSLKIEIHEHKNVSHHSWHHLHMIEEEILYRENRISEELRIIQDRIDDEHDHHEPHDHLDREKLILDAQALIKRAREAIAKSPESREAYAIDSEIISIEELLQELAESDKTDLRRVAQRLARHEATLKQLIARIEH